MFCRILAGGEWTAPESVSEFPVTGGRSIVVCTDRAGRLHAAWQNEEGLTFYRVKDAGEWGVTEALGQLGAQTSMAVEPGGTVHVVGGYRCGINYRRRLDGRWSPAEIVDDGFWARHASMTLDKTGRPHVVWVGDGYEDGWRVYHSRKAEDSWSKRQQVSPAGPAPRADDYHNPCAAMDDSGVLHVVFDSSTENRRKRLFYAAWEDGSLCSAIELPSGDAGLWAPQVRWSAWPESNRVSGPNDLDFLSTSSSAPLFDVMFRRGVKAIK